MIRVTAANGHVGVPSLLTAATSAKGRPSMSAVPPNSDRKFGALVSVALCRRFAPESKPSIRAFRINAPMPKPTPIRMRRELSSA